MVPRTETRTFVMKKITTAAVPVITDDDIRSYAEHLYDQSGRVPGHDLDNWLEAKACLEASIPREQSHRRLHEHLNGGRHRAASARTRAHAA